MIITDTFGSAGQNPLSPLQELRHLAFSSPLAVITAWKVSEAEAQQQGVTCLLTKLFDLEEFLTTLASCLNWQFTSEQELQATVLREYLTTLDQADFDKVLSLCTEEVVYQPPSPVQMAICPSTTSGFSPMLPTVTSRVGGRNAPACSVPKHAHHCHAHHPPVLLPQPGFLLALQVKPQSMGLKSQAGFARCRRSTRASQAAFASRIR